MNVAKKLISWTYKAFIFIKIVGWVTDDYTWIFKKKKIKFVEIFSNIFHRCHRGYKTEFFPLILKLNEDFSIKESFYASVVRRQLDTNI